ncbi:MAG: hypothetical protein ABW205_00295 [Burkholderiales bacterium]
MSKVQGVKEKLHSPIYDAFFVPKDITFQAEMQKRDPRVIRFFVDVQNKTRLETNLQASGVLPSLNTFEARALRVVVSSLHRFDPGGSKQTELKAELNEAEILADLIYNSVTTLIRAIERDTLSLMMEHDWPGNVRELENAIEHAVIVERDAVIVPSSLPMNLSKTQSAQGTRKPSGGMGLREKLNLAERQILLETRTNWIRKHAASMLQVDPRNMPYLMRKHHLRENEPRH